MWGCNVLPTTAKPNYETLTGFLFCFVLIRQQLSLLGYPCFLLPGSGTLRPTAGPPWEKIPASIIHLDLSNSIPPIICQRYSFTTGRTYTKIYLFALPFGYTNLLFWDCVLIGGEVIVSSQGARRCNENALNLWPPFLFALCVVSFPDISQRNT